MTWSKGCVITNSTGEGKFAITETKLYVPLVISSTKDNEKLRQQIKSGFKKTISWNKCESSIITFAQNRHLNYLINPSFQWVNRLFVLSFENENDRTSHSTYYLPNLDRDGNTKIFFIIEEAKKTIFEFSQRTVKVLWMQFHWDF